MATYPFPLRKNCRPSVFAEILAAIVHHTRVVIGKSKGIDVAYFVKVVPRPCCVNQPL